MDTSTKYVPEDVWQDFGSDNKWLDVDARYSIALLTEKDIDEAISEWASSPEEYSDKLSDYGLSVKNLTRLDMDIVGDRPYQFAGMWWYDADQGEMWLEGDR